MAAQGADQADASAADESPHAGLGHLGNVGHRPEERQQRGVAADRRKRAVLGWECEVHTCDFGRPPRAWSGVSPRTPVLVDTMSRTSLRVRVRQRVGSKAVDAVLTNLARVGQLNPRARRHLARTEVTRDLHYGPLAAHRLDVWRPKHQTGRLPALVYVHGGGFRILSKETHWVFALRFALQGYVVFNINYRLAPKDPYPAAAADVCQALLWVRRHAEDFDADLDGLVVAGESAGGNLTCAAAVATAWRRPEPWAREVFDAGIRLRAALPACGLLQVSDYQRFVRRRPDIVPWVADRIDETCIAYGRGLDDYGLADPLVVLENAGPPDRPLPPAFALVGTRDPLLDDTRRLGAAWNAHGSRCEVGIYPGGIHAFHAMPWDPNASQAWRDQRAFLESL